ncbi:MAG: PorT family protein [Cyclobacteriaceae bacterium]|nr:PorT family protein [Cyclobacteriaceae bacterium]
MKKLCVIGLFLLISAGVNAQKIGIKVGANFADAKIEEDGIVLDTKSKIGIVIGIAADFKIVGGLGINTGVDFGQKGTKWSEEFMGAEIEFATKLNYIIIPARLAYTFETGSLGIFIEAGPYFGIGLDGKSEITMDGETEVEDVKFGSDDEADLTNPDIGLSAGLGIYAGPIRAAINYDPGLVNISNLDSGSIKTGSVIISVAFLFIK